MYTPDELEHGFTLLMAASRYEELRTRDALAPSTGEADPLDTADPTGTAASTAGDDRGDWGAAPLTRDEALEMLALGELLARKAGYGRQLAVRTARATGASWSQIGAALGTSKQSAWEAHTRWIEDQVAQHRRSGYEGLDDERAAAARELAGPAQETPRSHR